MTDEINQKLLLYKLQTKKDPEAFAQLYDIYAPRIYRFVFFKVSNHEEAEDITSDVFLKAWHYINEQKRVESFSGLLYRIARNLVIDLYRRRTNQPVIALEKIEIGDKGDLVEELSDKIESKKIIQDLEKLKYEYKEIVTLRYVDGLEISEIATITGKGEIAVRVTIHRALKKLKNIVGKKENQTKL